MGIIGFWNYFNRKQIITDFSFTIVYLLLLSLLRFTFSFELVYLWVGGVIGTEFLIIFEEVFKQDLKYTYTVFKTIIFQLILLLLTFYVLSSTGSIFVSSLVLTMNLHLLKDQLIEYLKSKTLSPSWYLYLKKDFFTEKTTRMYLIIVSILFLTLTILFIRH